MKVIEILASDTEPKGNRTIRQFFRSASATTSLGQLLFALVAETIWSSEYEVCANFSDELAIKFLQITHPAFLPGEVLVVHEKNCTLSVDGVKDAVLAHIDALLKTLQEQSIALRRKSAALERAQSSIYEKTATAAVVAQRPEAAECRLFARYGRYDDLTCFILGHGFGHTTFVARGGCPEFNGGIVRLDMPGDEWHHLTADEKYGVFFAALARAFVTQKLQVKTEDHLCCPKMSVTTNPIGPPQVDKIVFEFDGLRIDVMFGDDNLPIEAKYVD